MKRGFLSGCRIMAAANILLIALLSMAGCASNGDSSAEVADEQLTFATPQQALDALDVATRDRDNEALQQIFGPELTQLKSGNPQQDDADFQRFAAALGRNRVLVPQKDGSMILEVGADNWQFPVPLIKDGKRWRFDTAAGAEEVIDRRIGTNELGAIAACRSYVRTQQEYFAMDPDGDCVQAYAPRIRSTPGKRDGLYWPDEPGQPTSPIGPAVARAVAAGQLKTDEGPQPYRGYYYKILTTQGPAAPGGAKDYIDSTGRMTGGFALLAWPAEYGRTGIMAFIVGPDGMVYQRDLGEQTAEIAKTITTFDPAKPWTPVNAGAR